MIRLHTSWSLFVGACLAVGCGAADESGGDVAKIDAPPTGEGEARTEGASPNESPGATPATPPAPQPPPPTSATDFATEKAWAEAQGVTIQANEVTVVAKRFGDDERMTTYGDTFVVFKKDGTLARFVGTTKPAQMPNPTSGVVPDANGDGKKDLGIVRPGVYLAKGSVKFGLSGHERDAFKVYTLDGTSTSLPAWRDLSGDGVFSASEKTTAEQKSYTMGGIYIHYGFAPTGTSLGSNTYAGPWSVGCQNIQYGELDSFIAAVGGKDAVFRFAIVDAD